MRRIESGKQVLKLTVAATLIMSAGAFPASAGTAFGESELASSECGNGRLVINVTQRVENDVDSKVGGGYWALTNYTRTIHVRETGPGEYCGVVKYEGQYQSVGNRSPGGGGTLAAGTRGPMQGGYRARITGDLRSSPAKRSHGSIGTQNYACSWTDDGDQNFESGEESCPGKESWLGYYFENVGAELDWWGWRYHDAGSQWVNACTGPDSDCPGNSGDIAD